MAEAKQATAAEELEDDPWSTGTGLQDDFDGIITEAFFGTDETYNAEAVIFVATLTDDDGQPITTLKYSVGKDWIPSDDGTSITHPRKGKINESSRFGFFIDRIAQPTTVKAPKHRDVTSPKGMENGLGLGPLLRKKGTSPLEAKSYEGLKFHWNLHEMQTMGTDAEGKRVVKQTLLPTAYIGEVKSTNGAGTAAAAKATTPIVTGAAANAGGGGSSDVDVPAALRKALTAKAQSSDARTFTRAASKDPAVIAADDSVMNHILDSGPSGFWASVQP